jgi:hypothetical protein
LRIASTYASKNFADVFGKACNIATSLFEHSGVVALFWKYPYSVSLEF